jgi:hypothetical protein
MKNKKEKEEIAKPILEPREIIQMHPAIDFKDKGYFGVWLPTDEGNERLFLVTSHREILSTQKEALNKIRLTHYGVKLPYQWSIESVREFINSFNSVIPKELFEEIKDIYASYIEFPAPEIYDLMAVWVLGTYLFPLFNTFPYIYIGGVKQTGKSKTLHVTALLSFNAIFSTSVTSAALFRLVQDGRCSLFMDETEKLSNPERFTEFRALLLSGYKKSGVVQRTEKDSKDRFIVKNFEVYSPKMLGNIFGLEDILEDRCIKIIMKRTLNKEIGEKEIYENDSTWQQTRDKCYVFALENWKEIKEIYETLPNETKLSNREWELWHPLLSIAAFINKEVYERLVKLAEQKAEEKEVENVTESAELILIQALAKVVSEKTDYIPVRKIKEAMVEFYEGEEQRWLTNKWVGNCLRRLGITNKRRVGTGIEYQLNMSIVNDLLQRFKITPTLSSLTTLSSPNSECSELSEHNEDANLKDKEEIEKAIEEESRKIPEILKRKGIKEHVCYRCGSTLDLIQTEDFITHEPLWICSKCLKEVDNNGF